MRASRPRAPFQSTVHANQLSPLQLHMNATSGGASWNVRASTPGTTSGGRPYFHAMVETSPHYTRRRPVPWHAQELIRKHGLPASASAPRMATLGGGYNPSLSRTASLGSPMNISHLGKGHLSAYHPLPKLRQSTFANEPPQSTWRPATADEARDMAKAVLGRGVGIQHSIVPPWTSRPAKAILGCSGIIGI